MATIDWLGTTDPVAGGVRRMSFGGSVAKSAFSGFFTGQTQSISHLANRLRCNLTLRACSPVAAAKREAWLLGLIETGDLVRLGHLQRPEPNGTMRGTPTLAASAAKGARSINIQTAPAVAGATLLGGDPLGIGSQLLFVGHAGAVADGAGLFTAVPLMWPLRAALTSSAGVTWNAPYTTWQCALSVSELPYGRGAWQGEIDLPFTEVY